MPLTLIVLTLLTTPRADAAVLWGNPEKVEVVMDGADEAWADVDTLTYHCPGQSDAVFSIGETVDLIQGLELPAEIDTDCSLELTTDDPFVIGGTDAGGSWSVVVTETTLILTAPSPPLDLDHDVISGSPLDAPALAVE